MKPPSRDCPLCGQASECVDWVEVDIGVGTMVGNQEYLCPTHGEWGERPLYASCTAHEDCAQHPEIGWECANQGPRFVFLLDWGRA